MNYKLFLPLCLLSVCVSCNQHQPTSKENSPVSLTVNDTSKQEISCKLTTPQLQERKETVIAQIKKEVLEKKELPNGYSYKFNGNDSIYIQLTDFIRSERACCDFFTFNLKVSDEKSFIWMDITGPDGVKQMLNDEAGL